MDPASIRVGDILSRPKCYGVVQHIGICVGHDLVLSNMPEKGEHLSSVEEFCDGEPLSIRPSGADPVFVIARARKILSNPRRYHAVFRNCQHTTNEAAFGVAKSPAMKSGMSIALSLLIGIVRVVARARAI
jgi:hypothetical protein